VDGAVAADGDEKVGVGGRLAGELGQVARPLGEQGVAAQPQGGRAVGELGPAAPRGAVLGSRVDQERDALNGAP
jgi:hypothetical protein